ncbi:MAG TPA: hypothetical protein HA362_07145 [Nanoarchaeota archaeon]|nr:hypothetical protein [Nanoarchaeota archaeon]
MLENISGIRALKENIEAVEKRIASLEEQHKEMGSLLQGIEKGIAGLKSTERGYSDAFSKDLDKIKYLQKEFEKALRTFQQNNSQLYDSIYTKLHNELKSHIAPIQLVANEFTAVKPEIRKLQESTQAANDAVNRLVSVSQHIKKEDFELKEYAKELLKADSEKLRLMREIETLKKIIAHERRNRH